jgi:hypothetical protein
VRRKQARANGGHMPISITREEFYEAYRSTVIRAPSATTDVGGRRRASASGLMFAGQSTPWRGPNGEGHAAPGAGTS